MQTNLSRSALARFMEHRWGERVEVDCPARVVMCDGAAAEGRLRNASISGAFIATAVRPAPLTTLSVQLICGTGQHRRSIELPACVVRTDRDGIAVEWRDMAVPTLVELLRESGATDPILNARDRVFG
jgi:hypothetical protein